MLSTKQSLKPDKFIYVVGTIIANVQFFTWKKSGNTVCHSLNYKEGIRAPIVLALHANVSDHKLCFVYKMSSQTIHISFAVKGIFLKDLESKLSG